MSSAESGRLTGWVPTRLSDLIAVGDIVHAPFEKGRPILGCRPTLRIHGVHAIEAERMEARPIQIQPTGDEARPQRHHLGLNPALQAFRVDRLQVPGRPRLGRVATAHLYSQPNEFVG